MESRASVMVPFGPRSVELEMRTVMVPFGFGSVELERRIEH